MATAPIPVQPEFMGVPSAATNFRRSPSMMMGLEEVGGEEGQTLLMIPMDEPVLVEEPIILPPPPPPTATSTPIFVNNTPYRIDIVGEGFVPGGIVTDTGKAILSFDFKTSNYAKLQDKINALQVTQNIVGRIESDVIDLQVKVANYEGFDVSEIVPSQYSGLQPLIVAEADMNNSYYTTKIQPLMNYPNFFTQYGVTISRAVNEIGILPTRAVTASNYYLTAAQSSSYSTITNDRLPFVYDVNKIFNIDFIDLRTKIINKYLANMVGAPTGPMYVWVRPRWYLPRVPVLTQEWRNYFNSPAYQQSAAAASNGVGVIPVEMRPIVTSPFPFMTQGNYGVNFSVRLPVDWAGPETFYYGVFSPTLFNYNNPIQ
jgi:hypothetical protein